MFYDSLNQDCGDADGPDGKAGVEQEEAEIADVPLRAAQGEEVADDQQDTQFGGSKAFTVDQASL